MVELSIKLKKGQAKRFKKHLEMEHPITRGNIEIEQKPKKRRRSKSFGTRSQVRALIKSSPDFEKIAARAINI